MFNKLNDSLNLIEHGDDNKCVQLFSLISRMTHVSHGLIWSFVVRARVRPSGLWL